MTTGGVILAIAIGIIIVCDLILWRWIYRQYQKAKREHQ